MVCTSGSSIRNLDASTCGRNGAGYQGIRTDKRWISISEYSAEVGGPDFHQLEPADDMASADRRGHANRVDLRSPATLASTSRSYL